MSTSFIYHAYGLGGYEYVSQKFTDGAVFIKVKPGARLVRCSCCKSYEIIHRGVTLRVSRSLPIGVKPVWLKVEVPRIQCLKCGHVRLIRLRIADPRRRYTRAFARYVLFLTKMMTLKDVSHMQRCSPKFGQV